MAKHNIEHTNTIINALFLIVSLFFMGQENRYLAVGMTLLFWANIASQLAYWILGRKK